MGDDKQDTGWSHKIELAMDMERLLSEGITVETGDDITVIIADETIDVSA